jgi:hypothetical protein
MARHEHQGREIIWGGRVMGARRCAKTARKAAKEAVQKADRAEAEARMEGYGGLAQARAAERFGGATHQKI